MKELQDALQAFDRGEIDRTQLFSLEQWREAPSAKAKLIKITN